MHSDLDSNFYSATYSYKTDFQKTFYFTLGMLRGFSVNNKLCHFSKKKSCYLLKSNIISDPLCYMITTS